MLQHGLLLSTNPGGQLGAARRTLTKGTDPDALCDDHEPRDLMAAVPPIRRIEAVQHERRYLVVRTGPRIRGSVIIIYVLCTTGTQAKCVQYVQKKHVIAEGKELRWANECRKPGDDSCRTRGAPVPR